MINKKQKFNIAIRKVKWFVKNEKLPIASQKQVEYIRAFYRHFGISFINQKDCLNNLLVKLYDERKELFGFVAKRPKKNKRERASLFYDTEQWQRLRVMTLKFYGVKCMKCAAIKTEMHVDHIKPISKYPDLKLCFGNLQVLCKKCNLEKSNINEIDYRPFAKIA